MASTKAFNLAGIQTAAVIVPDGTLRHKVSRALNTDEVAEANVFAGVAPYAAFTHGGEWPDELREYLLDNRKYAEKYIAEKIKGLCAVHTKATYLFLVDCMSVIGDSSQFCRFIRKHNGLYLSDGNDYPNGEGFLRMNLACPRRRLEDRLKQLKAGVEAYEEWLSGQCCEKTKKESFNTENRTML